MRNPFRRLAPQKSRPDTATPAEAVNLNVEGRQTVGPLMGFGQLWHRTYRIHLGEGWGNFRVPVRQGRREAARPNGRSFSGLA